VRRETKPMIFFLEAVSFAAAQVMGDGPPEVGVQTRASNHPGAAVVQKIMVVSDLGKGALLGRQVSVEKVNESEPLMTHREIESSVETAGVRNRQDQSEGYSALRWARRKYKGLQRHERRSYLWIWRVTRSQPQLFVHWRAYGRAGGRAMGAV